MDGASHAQVFFRIILPLVRPILAVTGLLAFVGVIGEFLLASIFLRDYEQQDAGGRALRAHRRRPVQQPRRLRAAAVLTAIPVVLLFQYLQKFIVGGITAGAVKG